MSKYYNAFPEAWRQEKNLIQKTGQGTRRWSKSEIKELLSTGKVKGYEVHHINNVANNHSMAGNPNNIKFVRGRAEHIAEHGGHFANPTAGPLIDRATLAGL